MKNSLISFLCLALVFSCTKEENVNQEPEVIKVPEYSVSITAGEGGNVSNSGGTFKKDSEISVTATPSAEYLFQAWSDGSTDNPRTLKITADITITANFVKKQYDLTVNVVGEGAVTEEIVIQGGRYNSGSQIKLTATAEAGWIFNAWTGDIDTDENPITININSDKEVTVTFLLDTDMDGVPDSIDLDNNTRSGVPVDEDGVMLNPIYLDDNGVTIKAFEWSEVGDKGIINDKEYTVIDTGILYELRSYVEGQGLVVHGDLSSVVTSKVVYMVELFGDAVSFNQDISSWDISNVMSLRGMFRNARVFNQNIGSWDVSNITDMDQMFAGALEFNQDIGNWDVSNVKTMYGMFAFARNFNQDIGSWDVSNVTNMLSMFKRAEKFNQPIDNWDVRNVSEMGSMFQDASSFNQPLENWNVSNVIRLGAMFMGASSFNGNITGWDVSNVINMQAMFKDALSINQDLSSWNVSKVFNCVQFDQGANSWSLPKPNFTNCNPD